MGLLRERESFGKKERSGIFYGISWSGISSRIQRIPETIFPFFPSEKFAESWGVVGSRRAGWKGKVKSSTISGAEETKIY